MTVGFIGCGNMGGALARAVRLACPEARILLADGDAAKAAALAEAIGAQTADNVTVASSADFIFLGVKPQVLAGMLSGIAPSLSERDSRFVLISMAAGVKIEKIRALCGEHPVIRIMPNTPVSVGEGAVMYDLGPGVTEAEERAFLGIMARAGLVTRIKEELIDAGSAVSGCGPAFLDLFVEALADGGVACGLPRDRAMMLAAQMALGSAKLILQSGKHPGELKDAVCSPGGSTIAGVRALEAGAFRGAVMEAVIAAYEKTKELG